MPQIEPFRWLSKGPGVLIQSRPRLLPSMASFTHSTTPTPDKSCPTCGGIHTLIEDKVCGPFTSGEDRARCTADFEKVFSKGLRGELSSEERRSQFRSLFEKYGIKKKGGGATGPIEPQHSVTPTAAPSLVFAVAPRTIASCIHCTDKHLNTAALLLGEMVEDMAGGSVSMRTREKARDVLRQMSGVEDAIVSAETHPGLIEVLKAARDLRKEIDTTKLSKVDERISTTASLKSVQEWKQRVESLLKQVYNVEVERSAPQPG